MVSSNHLSGVQRGESVEAIPDPSPRAGLVVDVHSHIYPRWYLQFFSHRSSPPRVVREDEGLQFLIGENAKGRGYGPFVTDDLTSLDAKLAFMDYHSIDVSVVSLGNPWLDVFQGEESLELAYEANSRLADYARLTDGRIYAMGVLPRGDPQEVAETVRVITRTPGLTGVVSGPLVAGYAVDDSRLEPVWDELSSSGMPLFIHPSIPRIPNELEGYGLALSAGVGFPHVTTVTLARLLLGGVINRHPSLMILAAHAGGALPFLMSRIQMFCDSERDRIREAAGRLLFDTVTFDEGAFELALKLIGPQQMLFGTDHPFPTDIDAIRGVIAASTTPTDATFIEGGAALRWFQIPDQ